MPAAETTKTIRQPETVETLADRAISKVRRDEIGGKLLGRDVLRKHTKLTAILLREVRDHYVTYPSEIRAAIEEFLA